MTWATGEQKVRDSLNQVETFASLKPTLNRRLLSRTRLSDKKIELNQEIFTSREYTEVD
jgi:hypothetical protein